MDQSTDQILNFVHSLKFWHSEIKHCVFSSILTNKLLLVPRHRRIGWAVTLGKYYAALIMFFDRRVCALTVNHFSLTTFLRFLQPHSPKSSRLGFILYATARRSVLICTLQLLANNKVREPSQGSNPLLTACCKLPNVIVTACLGIFPVGWGGSGG